jgi:O-antigen/teichoic acid export membrane protein
MSQTLATPVPRLSPGHRVLAGLRGGTLARGAVLAFAIYAASAGLGYLLQTLLARVMPVAEYGAFTYASAWAEILAYPAGLGLNFAALRLLPKYRAEGRPDAVRGFVRGARVGTLLTGGAIGLAVLGWGVWARGATDARVWACVALLVPAHALAALYMQTWRAEGRIFAALAPSMVFRHLGVGCGVALLLWIGAPATAGTVMPVLTVTLLLALAAQGVPFHREMARSVGAGPATADRAEWRRVAGPLLLAALFAVLLGRLDLITLGVYGGAAEVGLYNAALKTASLAAFVLLAINMAAAPQITRLHATADAAGLQRLVSSSTRAAFAASLAFCVLLWTLGPWILSAFGPEYRASYPALAVLLLGHLIAAAVGLVNNLLNMTGHQMRCLATYTGAVSLALILNLVLVPRYGMVGAAWATVVATAAAHVTLFLQVRRHVGIDSSVLSGAWGSR